MSAAIIDKITDPQPRQDASAVKEMSAVKGLTPADPHYFKPGRIDVLLGADVLPYIQATSGPPSSIIAVETVFGHAFMGTYNSTNSTWLPQASVQVAVEAPSPNADEQLNFSLSRFWLMQQPSRLRAALTPEEIRVQNHYALTHAFISHAGKYQIELPRKEGQLQLGDSKCTALRRYHSNETSLLRKGQWQKFQDVILEYLKLGHARPVTAAELQLPPSEVYYLPMHGVHKASSTTTKLRVVFDASSQTASGLSLNDTLAVGPMLHPPLERILVKFKTHRVALTGDIAKMYREILLAPSDQHFHRFFWRAQVDQPVLAYCMNRVTFGVSSSPYVAVQTLQQAGVDFGQGCPVAQHHINSSFYVDDLLGGADTVEGAMDLCSQLTKILTKGGFTLRKFRSSSAQVLSSLPEELVETIPTKELVDCHTASYPKALGVVWDSAMDTMSTDVTNPGKFAPTKRGILSDVSKTFDVLGWITPAVLPMKLLLQELWKLRKDWDEAIPGPLKVSHQVWREELPQLADIALPRCYFSPEPALTIQLHGFSDASEKAFAAVVYVRATYEHSPPTSRLVVAKSRVAPLKTRSIPELELCGAVLLTELLDSTMSTLNINADQVTAWCDSTIVLCWLSQMPSKYKTFVANRITLATSIVPASQWYHVPTKKNPASRGLSAGELREHTLWWNGPPWLILEPLAMPRQPQKRELEVCQDEGAKASSCLVMRGVPAVWLAHRYSSFRTLNHVTAWVMRAAYNFLSGIRYCPRNVDPHLTVEEVQAATRLLLLRSQLRSFNVELNGLTASPPKPIESSSHILCLHPFLGQDGLLHVGGRLSKAPLSYSQRHPVMLSAKDPLTIILFKSKHITLSHCGPTLLFSTIGSEYYVTGAKQLARSVCRSCVTCQKIAATPEQQLMGDLPAERVTDAPGFHTVGVDYAGPFQLKTSSLRRAPVIKGYLAVFVCFATKGVHLEVVKGLTTGAFLAAMKRFVSRRGLPKNIYSDNGSNFKGAKRDLEELYQLLATTEMTDSLRSFFLNTQTTWHTIPERAPHFGALWEAAVKSAKHHLKRVVGMQILTFDELYTVVTQVEACLNSRPLIDQHSHSPDGVQPLTPAHLLINKGLMAYPETELDLKVAQTDRWTLCQSLVQHFWKRWYKEYLHQLQTRRKWKIARPNLCVGDVVLMKDSSSFQTHWGLARVVKTYPGEDGLVRAVDVAVSKVTLPDKPGKGPISHSKMILKKSDLRRPVTRLALLVPDPKRDLSGPGGCPGDQPPV